MLQQSTILIRTQFNWPLSPGVFAFRFPTLVDMPPHDHLFLELVYVESGTAEHHCAGGVTQLQPGSIIVLRPHVWHAYLNPNKLVVLNCLIDPKFCQHFEPLLSALPSTAQLYRNHVTYQQEVPSFHYQPPRTKRLYFQTLFDRMLDEQERNKPGWQGAMTAIALELLIELARQCDYKPSPTTSNTISRQTSSRIDTAVTYLETHYHQQVSLDELALKVKLSPAHLSRTFKQKTGVGIIDYIHRLRCEEACRMLRLTDHSISRIAMDVGYDELAYFSRCFRKQIGYAPRTYRQIGNDIDASAFDFSNQQR
ncbi:MAG: helix-turn-helix domain-containing protein [Phycisphaeraceae bacterium]|nr:helix-turn-helix domain-containing protein [Phycisphaeraceae bacterium]